MKFILLIFYLFNFIIQCDEISLDANIFMEMVKKLEQIEQNQSLQDIKIDLLNSTLLKIADVETQIENQVEDIMNVQSQIKINQDLPFERIQNSTQNYDKIKDDVQLLLNFYQNQQQENKQIEILQQKIEIQQQKINQFQNENDQIENKQVDKFFNQFLLENNSKNTSLTDQQVSQIDVDIAQNNDQIHNQQVFIKQQQQFQQQQKDQLENFMKFQQQNDKQTFKFQTPVQETISMTSQLQKDQIQSKLDQIENQDRIKGQQLNYFGKTQFKDQDYIDSRSVDILKQQLDQIQNKNLSDFQIKKLVEIQNLILNQNYQSLGDVLSDSNYEYGLLKKNESNQKNQILDQVKTKVTYIQNLQSKIKNDKIDQQNEEQQQDQQQKIKKQNLQQNQQQNQYQIQYEALLKKQDQTQIKQQNQSQTQINQQQYQQDQQKSLIQGDQIYYQKTQQKNDIVNDKQNKQQYNQSDQNIRLQENTPKQKDFQSEKQDKLSKITIIPQKVFSNIFEKQPPIFIEYPNQDVSKMPDSSSQLKKQDQIYKFQPRYYSEQKDLDKVENFQYKLKNTQKDEPIYVKPEMIPSKPQIQHVIQAPHQQSVVSTNFDLNPPPQYTINSYFQPTNGQVEQLPSQSFTLNQDLDQINLNYMPSQADPNIELEEQAQQFLQTGAI